MSVMDKFLKAIQLTGDDEGGYYDSDDVYYDSSSKNDIFSNTTPIGKDVPAIDLSEEKKKKKMKKIKK